jgi:hypothetical protein
MHLSMSQDIALIMELCRLRPEDLPSHFSRNTQIAADRLDRHLSRKIRQTNWRSSPQPASRTRPPKRSGGPCEPLSQGSRLDADRPENGVLIPCRFTPGSTRRRLNRAWHVRPDHSTDRRDESDRDRRPHGSQAELRSAAVDDVQSHHENETCEFGSKLPCGRRNVWPASCL